jgi:hypothetical protein
MGGCGASVSVGGGVIRDNGRYLAAWSQGWKAVERDSVPYIPTATSPGVCNRGGDRSECFETDAHVAVDLNQLFESLKGVPIPSQYRAPTAEMVSAMSTYVHGLSLPMHALEAGNYTEAQRDAWFTESKTLMLEANAMAHHAYASFPQWARPTPAPLI